VCKRADAVILIAEATEQSSLKSAEVCTEQVFFLDVMNNEETN
jgi:hypothetical protein